MPPGTPCSSGRCAVAAEAVLSRQAREAIESLPAGTRGAVERAIRAIERDPSWGARPARFLAPADSRHHGYIVDLSVAGWAIVYRVVDRGAAVEIPDIYRIMIG